MDKEWYKNLTLWGTFIMILGFILAKFGYTITEEQQAQIAQLMVIIVSAIMEVVGVAMNIKGTKKDGKEIKALRMSVAKLSTMPKEGSEQSFIDLSNKILGEGPTAVLSTAFFLTTKEWKNMFSAVKVAIGSEKGKILMEQLKKLGDNSGA